MQLDTPPPPRVAPPVAIAVEAEPPPPPADEPFPEHLLQYGMEGFMERAIAGIVSKNVCLDCFVHFWSPALQLGLID